MTNPVKKILLAVLLAILPLALVIPASATPRPLTFGLYAAGDHPITPSDYAGFGQAPAASIYYAWQLTSDVMTPSNILTADKTQGVEPFIELQTGSEPLTNVAAGDDNTQLAQSAAQIKANGQHVYMTFDHEMNGNWHPWNGSAYNWIRAWNDVTRVMNAGAPGLITWIWAPNVNGGAANPYSWWRNGNQFVLRVNEIGLDGYLCITQTTGSCTQSFASVFSQSISQIRQYAGRFPDVVSETGIGSPDNRTTEINAMVNAARSEGFQGEFYFNQDHFTLTTPEEKAFANALS